VGEDQQSFGIHKDIICFHSPYFKAAFDGSFQEATTGETTLETTNAKIFGLLVEWLYTGTIKDKLIRGMDLDQGKTRNRREPTFSGLVDLLLLAQYLQIPKLQNQAVEVFLTKWQRKDMLGDTFEHNVYENTNIGSPLRALICDAYVWSSLTPQSLKAHQDRFPKEMLFDLFLYERTRWMEGHLEDPLEYRPKYFVDEDTEERRR
jgi:hypothetical protein